MDLILSFAGVLFALWLVGLAAFSTMGWLVHAFLAMALVLLVVRLVAVDKPLHWPNYSPE